MSGSPSGRAPKRATLRDVARLAGVSVQTASNATRGHHKLMGAETLKRVEAAMRELDYHPNVTARGLREAKTRTLGFLVLDESPSFLADPLTALIMSGVGDVARDADYGVLLRAERPLDAHDALLKPLHEGRVDAAAVVLSGDPALRQAYMRKLVSTRVPFVVFDELVDDDAIATVRTNERETSQALAEHLIRKGHERIAFIAARVPWAVVEQRHLGYRDALEAAGIAPDPDVELYDAAWQAEGGRRMAERLLTRPNRPTAVMCGSDVLAVGAISAAKDVGLTVPDDLAVTGFDDFEFSAYTDPPLSTVHIPGYAMGRIAAMMLLEMLDGKEPSTRQVVLKNSLALRRSGNGLRGAHDASGRASRP